MEIVPQKESNQNQKIVIEVGEKVQVEGKVQFTDGKITNDVVWKSENDKIATVDSQGFIEGISAGKVNILLSSREEPKQSTSLEIIVKPIKEKEIEIANDNLVLNKEDQDYLNKINQELQKKQLENNKKSYDTTFMLINVYDNNNDLVKDININAKSLIKEISWNFNKKSETGSLLIEDVPNECLIDIYITKEKWNTKKRLIITKGQVKSKNNPLIINFGKENDLFYSFQYEPEISKVTFNSKEIAGLIYDNNIDYINPPDISEKYIKVKAPLSKITLSFNKAVNKKSVEDNIEIISQRDSKGNFTKFTKDNGLVFTWDRFDTNLDISLNSSLSNILYRLQIKNPYSDIEGNQSKQGRYISFANQEIYNDYINFLIEL
ncbi:MAG: Ig-like domain-containing protein [Candidatus Sericytochromatia bacterium]